MHVGKHIPHANRSHIEHNNIKKCIYIAYTNRYFVCLFEGKRAELQKQNHRGPHSFGHKNEEQTATATTKPSAQKPKIQFKLNLHISVLRKCNENFLFIY